MSPKAHHHRDASSVACAVITVSDTRTAETDRSGQHIQELLRRSGHRITQYEILRDEPELIIEAIRAVPLPTEVIILNGGTGLTRRDATFDAVSHLFEKEITGFGELFRLLSYADIGAAAMLSRAVAGVVGDRVVFSVPGSPAAVELAMTKLIVPALGHVVGLVRG
jgi:molybdenum cofactor biosynthesis protein B